MTEPRLDDDIALGINEEEELDDTDPGDGADRMWGDDD
jgi:hypothetical protein